MPEYLEANVDKFTFCVATDRLYDPQGVWVLWVKPAGIDRVRVGLTDFLQQHSGDIAFVSIKAPGTTLQVGDEFAELETVKVNVSMAAPVGGTIVEINETLEQAPEFVNQDPYGNGWLAVIETTSWETDRANLLDPSAYLSAMRSQVDEELKKG